MNDPELNIANIFGVLSPAMEKNLTESWNGSSPDPCSDLHVLPTTWMKLSSTKGTLPGPAHNWRRGSERSKKGNRRKVSTQTHNKQGGLSSLPFKAQSVNYNCYIVFRLHSDRHLIKIQK